MGPIPDLGRADRRHCPNPNSLLLDHLERCEETMAAACARPWQEIEQAPRRRDSMAQGQQLV